MKFKFIPHTADMQFKAYGKSLEQAFINSAYALTNIISKEKIKPLKKKTIKADGRDLQQLLYDFLEQFLILIDADNFILSKIKNIKIEKKKRNYKLTAEVLGDNLENYKSEMHVKAVTYHKMRIEKVKDKFVCQVIVDI